MRILISHAHGNQNSRHAAIGLRKHGLLTAFFTSITVYEGSVLHKLSKISFLSILKRRMFDSCLKNISHTYPWLEICRNVRFLPDVSSYEVIHNLDKKVAEYISKHEKDIDAVYAYDEGAYYSFNLAKQKGIKCIFELPIIHWRTYRKLLEEEKVRNPEWFNIISVFDDPIEKLLRKDEELKMADAIFVASPFTKESIVADFPEKITAPIYVIPYGFPEVNRTRQYISTEGRKLKFLYVGRLSQSKGLSYMFDAIKSYQDSIELTVVGKKVGYNDQLEDHLRHCAYIPYLLHNDVLKLMGESDVLIFPSLFEGFGMVVTEAMSQGTPVIATNRTCAKDFVINGENGWLIDAASTQAIEEAIEDVFRNRCRLEEIGRAAMNTASKRPWSKYQEELAESVNDFLNGKLS